MRFNIDEIRDRYSMLQLISHLGRLYKSSTNMSLPLKLVQYLAQIKTGNSLNILLKYISLCELYTFNNSSTVDQGKKITSGHPVRTIALNQQFYITPLFNLDFLPCD